jgi:DNA (cytosine-5)-methyltransferase 1
MNELALFAGAGGGILGSQLLGSRVVCAVEWDAYCASVLVARQADRSLRPFPIWDDVRTFDGRPWRGVVDLVSGGFPCQVNSGASRGRRVAEDLWPEFLRIVADVAPGAVFAENVTRGAIDAAADDLEALGFTSRCIALSAKDWVLTTFGSATGFLHTPTHTANYACRRCKSGRTVGSSSACLGSLRRRITSG